MQADYTYPQLKQSESRIQLAAQSLGCTKSNTAFREAPGFQNLSIRRRYKTNTGITSKSYLTGRSNAECESETGNSLSSSSLPIDYFLPLNIEKNVDFVNNSTKLSRERERPEVRKLLFCLSLRANSHFETQIKFFSKFDVNRHVLRLRW